MDTCETINESMIQVIFQLSIILATMHSKPPTTLQILVVTISLLMASKGPAEDFLASKMRRLKQGKIDIKDEGVGEKMIMKELHVKQEEKGNATDDEAVHTEEKEKGSSNEEAVSKHSIGSCFCLTTKIEYYHEMDFFEKLPMIGECFYHSCSCLKKGVQISLSQGNRCPSMSS